MISHIDELDPDEVEQIQNQISRKIQNILSIFVRLEETVEKLKGLFNGAIYG